MRSFVKYKYSQWAVSFWLVWLGNGKSCSACKFYLQPSSSSSFFFFPSFSFLSNSDSISTPTCIVGRSKQSSSSRDCAKLSVLPTLPEQPAASPLSSAASYSWFLQQHPQSIRGGKMFSVLGVMLLFGGGGAAAVVASSSVCQISHPPEQVPVWTLISVELAVFSQQQWQAAWLLLLACWGGGGGGITWISHGKIPAVDSIRWKKKIKNNIFFMKSVIFLKGVAIMSWIDMIVIYLGQPQRSHQGRTG